MTDGPYHWVALTAIMIFAVGMLTSAITTVLVALVSVKEAHGAETALKKFVDGEMDRTQVLFFVENQAFRVADFATASGVAAGAAFLVGGIISIVLLMLFSEPIRSGAGVPLQELKRARFAIVPA